MGLTQNRGPTLRRGLEEGGDFESLMRMYGEQGGGGAVTVVVVVAPCV